MPAKGAAIERTAVSERTALERIRAIATVRDGTLAGIGDDAAVLATTARTVVCHDMLVDGVHFRRDATPMRDLGHKALAVNLSDLAAMGASPLAALVGIALPPDGLTTDELGDLYAGMEALAAAHGVSIAGGDTTRGPGLTLAVTALGTLGPGDEALTRSGGRPGDLLCVTGPLGAAAAGLHLADGRVDAGATDHVATLIAALRRPEPRVAEGRLLAAAGAHTAMDISDGLALDAERDGAVDHAKDPTTLLAFSDHNLGGVGGGTKDGTYLGDRPNGTEDIHRVESIAEKQNEAVAGADCLRILLRQRDHVIVGAAPADQAFAGGFAEGQAELDAGHMGDQGLVNILDGLDEM